jgi:mRNA-degrading endonuclease RelE of RelBE toxin-antitoxin system
MRGLAAMASMQVRLIPMRKNIDIPDEIVKDLKKLAVDADKDLKNYIQELLVEHVKKAKKK